MSSAPSLASTARKEAGIETRPFASILLSNLDANSSIHSSGHPSATRNRPRDARQKSSPLHHRHDWLPRRETGRRRSVGPLLWPSRTRLWPPPPESYPSERVIMG